MADLTHADIPALLAETIDRHSQASRFLGSGLRSCNWCGEHLQDAEGNEIDSSVHVSRVFMDAIRDGGVTLLVNLPARVPGEF